MFTWFGPGISRQSVSALRNSSFSIQRRRSTRTSCAQAERPPPKLASATSRKASASSPSVGSGAGAPSLMDEVRIVRQLARVVRGGVERVGRAVVLALVPVVLERRQEALDDGGGVHHDAELTAQVERAAVDVHRAEERTLAVGDQELRVELQVLLPVHLDVAALEDAERGERVGHVPGA